MIPPTKKRSDFLLTLSAIVAWYCYVVRRPEPVTKHRFLRRLRRAGL